MLILASLWFKIICDFFEVEIYFEQKMMSNNGDGANLTVKAPHLFLNHAKTLTSILSTQKQKCGKDGNPKQ